MNFRQRFRMWLAWWNFRDQFDAFAAQFTDFPTKLEGMRYDVQILVERQQQFHRQLMQALERLGSGGVPPEITARLEAAAAKLDAAQARLGTATTPVP